MNAAPHPAAIPKKMQTVGTRRDLRRSLETRVNFWHAAIVSFFFIAVLGASLFLGAVMVIGQFAAITARTH